jgi:uncharacterized membrane protein SirB2
VTRRTGLTFTAPTTTLEDWLRKKKYCESVHSEKTLSMLALSCFQDMNPRNLNFLGALMQRLLRYLELILTAVGVLVVAIVFSLFRNIGPWKAAAVAAVAVGILHGIIFFSVRTAQRRARNEALASVRLNLDDLIRNKLQVVLCATEIDDGDWRTVVHGAVTEIEDILHHIEQEPLTSISR